MSDGPGAEQRSGGRVKEITSTANPIVKDIRALSNKKDREATGTFLSEGLGFVLGALDRGWPIRTLVHAIALRADPRVRDAVRLTLQGGGLVIEASEAVLTAISRRDNPQPVMGVFAQHWRGLDAVRPQPDETLVALDRVRDPGNLGTIIRTADAAGASGVVLIGECTDPFGLEAVRATMGSLLAMPLSRCSEAEFLAWQKRSGATVVATHLDGAVDYRQVDYAGRPVVVLMGTEQSGLTDGLARAADQRVRIPQQGSAESLNLAVATGVMLYEVRRHLLGV